MRVLIPIALASALTLAAGVSALMKDIPDKAVAAKPKRGRPPKAKKRVRRRKAYRSSR